METFFIGSAISVVDEASRIALPPAFSTTLRSRSFDGRLFIGRHEEGHCLVGFDSAFFAQQHHDVDWRASSLVGGSRAAHDKWLRRTFAFVEETELTDTNLITIGPIIRARGEIGTGVLLVGAGQRFEIWDLATVMEYGPHDLRWVAERHLKSLNMGHPADEMMRALSLPTATSQLRPRTLRAPPRKGALPQAA